MNGFLLMCVRTRVYRIFGFMVFDDSIWYRSKMIGEAENERSGYLLHIPFAVAAAFISVRKRYIGFG
jgi:hypothetical protein